MMQEASEVTKKKLLVTLWLLVILLLLSTGDLRVEAGNVLNTVNLYWKQPFPCGHPLTVTLQTNEGAMTVWTCKVN